jgi:hypothetical protein
VGVLETTFVDGSATLHPFYVFIMDDYPATSDFMIGD